MKRQISFFCILLTLLSGKVAQAQIINIDKIDTACYTTKAQWDGHVAAGVEIDKQQQTLYDASNFIDVSLQKKRELLIFSASNRFTYNGPEDFLNTGYLHLRWRRNYKDQLHPESFIQYQWDTKRGMQHRYIAGANLRYNFWHKRMWEMTFATGIFYENETWNFNAVDSTKLPANTEDVKTSTAKSNSYVKWEGSISQTSNIAIAVFYQSALYSFFTPRIAVNVNLDVSISKHFALNFKFAGLYDAKPVVPIVHFYYTLSNNLVYKF